MHKNNIRTISACPKGEVLIGDECLEQTEPGDLCVDDKQCLNGSICKDGVCECRRGYVIYRGKCIVKETKAAVKCSISSQIPYREKGSNKVVSLAFFIFSASNNCLFKKFSWIGFCYLRW